MPAFLRHVALLAATTALVALACSSAANASRSFGLSPGGSISLVSDGGKLMFGYMFDGPTFYWECTTELSGTLDRTISKRPGQKIGEITDIAYDDCWAYRQIVPTVTPLGRSWDVTYLGFTGTLPTPATVELRIEGFSYEEPDPEFIGCLHRGSIDISVPFSGSPLTSGTAPVVGYDLPGTGPCNPWDGIVQGDFAFTTPQVLTLID